jgi:hypothetical protein
MRTVIPVSALLVVLAVGGCTTDVVNSYQIYDPIDAVQPYAQRADKIRLSAGDAQAVNTRIHEVDPWPRNVGDKRIYSNGQRMADAVWKYRCGKEPSPLPLVGEETSQLLVSGGGGAGGGASSGGTRPGSDCGGGQVQVQGQGH